MPKVKKLPKWAIRQAGGINKKAWALARRGKGRKMSRAKPSKRATRRAPRSVGGASHNNRRSNKKGYGAWFKMGRTIDVFSGPGQGAVQRRGLTADGASHAASVYTGGLSEGEFKPEIAKATAGSIGLGLIRDWFRSKLGVYRGLGQKKILSGVMAANPEILATTEVNPVDDISRWNDHRSMFDRAYVPSQHRWDVNPQTSPGSRFIKSLGLDAGVKITQKLAEHYLNPMLPPGYNF